MKFGVVTFPGSNCDDDMLYVLSQKLGQKVEKLWHKETDLKGADFIILPGGFSYGDYLRSGAIAKLSPIMGEIMKHAQKGGYVLGICNGFQILTESGLLDGALLHNDTQRFICKNVHLKATSHDTPMTKSLQKGQTFKIPIAHGEGRFYASDEVIDKLFQNNQVLFQYSSAEGEITDEFNPNGSVKNIAGICNATKNVFGMMPHPERAADEELNSLDGKLLFESLLNHCN